MGQLLLTHPLLLLFNMAKWNTFKWSDGTKWVDANGAIGGQTALIDRNAHEIALRIIHTFNAPPGSLASLVILSSAFEGGTRSQLLNGYEAFIDRNTNTQRISARITLTTDPLTFSPFSIDRISMLANQRSRVRPT